MEDVNVGARSFAGDQGRMRTQALFENGYVVYLEFERAAGCGPFFARKGAGSYKVTFLFR